MILLEMISPEMGPPGVYRWVHPGGIHLSTVASVSVKCEMRNVEWGDQGPVHLPSHIGIFTHLQLG